MKEIKRITIIDLIRKDGREPGGALAKHSQEFSSVCWSPDRKLFVAFATKAGDSRVWTSLDGITWIPRTTPWIEVAIKKDLFRPMAIPKGITWTEVTPPFLQRKKGASRPLG